LHGHNWKVGVTLLGDKLDNAGMLLDFHDLDAMIKEAVDKFDHRNLNEVEPFIGKSPSSESMAKVIYYDIAKRLEGNPDVNIKYCEVWENERSRARYYE
ncbi:MAG: 6-carboxytetrahydropterin synthase, partial [Deltaproteobacteria bacterium]|nr:6-carboxytetrahydropterin synthase [Deltaproteobacteria bacterium]